MTDRELLELAAKAAGFQFDPTVTTSDDRLYGCFDTDKLQGLYVWAPLTYDDDAFRLQVRVGLHVHCDFECKGHPSVEVFYFKKPGYECGIVCESGSDHAAATRRAIVRAAAEIGKEMK